MATITNLKVAFRKTVQPRDYESETAEIEFSLAIDDNEAEQATDIAGDMLEEAKDQVFKTLGRKKDRRRVRDE